MSSTHTSALSDATEARLSELESLLGESDSLLLIDALYRLRQDKVEALTALRSMGVSAGPRPFEARDFGIPQIDDLLRRLGAKPDEEAFTPCPPG